MPPTIPDNSPVDSLVSGTRRTDTAISVHLVGLGQDSQSDLNSVRSEGWSSSERARVQAALDSIAAVANVTFTITDNEVADFQLVLSSSAFEGPTSLAYFYPPNPTGQSVGVFNSDGLGWDTDGLREGGLGYATIVHELLHGLGLAHPHDGPNVLAGVTRPFDSYGRNGLNQGIYTTMSYNTGYNKFPSRDFGFGSEAGPMALDIAALQDLYGANTSYRTGNNTYQLDNSNSNGAAWKSIWDAGGNDTIIYSGDRNSVIDLREASLEYAPGGGGWVSSAAGVTGGFTIANGVVIENATGGNSDDRLIGNAVANNLRGRDGNDTLWGRTGNDTLDGGNNNDTLYGGSGRDNITGGSGSDMVSGGVGNDTLFAGSGNDTVSGDSGADTIQGQSGRNTLNGGSGADTVTGGSSVDRINGGSGHDNLMGANGNDVIFGGRGNDTLDGGANNDTLVGGMGADTLIGGAGADTFVFNFLSDSWAGDTTRDTISDFEAGIDEIDLSAIARGNGLTFIGSDAFDSSNGQVRVVVEAADTVVQLDRNGDGIADLEILVEGVTALTADDFIL